MDEEITPQLKILVVDDDTLNQQMMKFLLVQWGHDVSFAGNGIEAVNAVQTNQFDIVFMDLQMPAMDGVEASRKIREWENGNLHTYIVALTASYLPEKGQKLFESGIDNYIAKPFEVKHIQGMLKYAASSKQGIEAADYQLQAGEVPIQRVLNIRQGIERVGFSSVIYWSLLDEFVAGLPDRMDSLQDASTRQDFDMISQAAHNLKGVSANLGALQLYEYADMLDRAIGEGYTEKVADLVDKIRTAGVVLQRVAGMLFPGRNMSTNE